MATIALSPTQVSALECAGLECPDLSTDEAILADAWKGKSLLITAETREAIYSALNERSNAEDDFAEDSSKDVDDRNNARRAARSLSVLASRVLRVEAQSTNAVDPIAQPSGTPTPREKV